MLVALIICTIVLALLVLRVMNVMREESVRVSTMLGALDRHLEEEVRDLAAPGSDLDERLTAIENALTVIHDDVGRSRSLDDRLAAIESELTEIRKTVDRFVSATPAVEDQDGDVW